MLRLVVAVLCTVGQSAAFYEWAVDNGQFVDKHGRQRFFHGVNVVYKSAPYVPVTSEDGPLSFTATDAKFLQLLGMNVVRLGTMWGGVEPIEGTFNQTYMDEIKKIVRICEAHNIQVLIDFHQDALAEMFCGEGIPWWAAFNYGPQYRQFPAPISESAEMERRATFDGSYVNATVPSESVCQPRSRTYTDMMASYAAARNYEDLYINGRGLRDKFANYWRYLASEFKGDANIIGFELINEPASIWPRNYTESHFLQPMYDALADAIRDVDPARVLFFNPVTWDYGYPPTNAAVYDNGFSHVPGGAGFEDRSVYAYHYYDYDHLFHGEPYFQSKVATTQKLKGAGMVTEFQLEHVAMEGDQGGVHFEYGMDLMDANLLSWMAWAYKGYYPAPYLRPEDLPFVPTCTGCDSGLFPDLPQSTSVSWATAKTMARTYAQAVQGRATKMHFDSKTNVFTLGFHFDPTVSAPTEIYINRALGGGLDGRYAHGAAVNVTEGFNWTLNGPILTITAASSVVACEVVVNVSPHQASHGLVYA